MKPLTPEHVQMLREICEHALTFNKPVYLPLYVRDWLGSGTVAALEPEQIGGYIMLLAYCWDDPYLGLPNNEAKLARMSTLNGRWEPLRAEILKCFIPHPVIEGRLTSIKLIEVRHGQLVKQRQGQLGGEGKAKRTSSGQGSEA
jgi:uncharacterized protein YdaU (DUF1376 family)